MIASSTQPNETFDILAHAGQVERRQTYRRAGKVGLGVALLAASTRTGSIFRLFLAGMGGALVLRGLTNRSLKANVNYAKKAMKHSRHWRFEGGQRDLVDEASWESFPASDPPSFSPKNT